jgi:hypothetical protein
MINVCVSVCICIVGHLFSKAMNQEQGNTNVNG